MSQGCIILTTLNTPWPVEISSDAMILIDDVMQIQSINL